jgi:hypothetical protein
MRRHLPFLLVALLAAGCGGVPRVPDNQAEAPAAATQRRAQAAPPKYNLAGYPAAVREGYIDGCESAKNTSLARKDAGRMSGDAQYAMGWNDGFSLCK